MVATAFVLLLSRATVGAGPGDAGQGRVSGEVIGPDGRPAPGAEVIAAGGDWGDESPALLGPTPGAVSPSTPPPRSACATARPSGRTGPGRWRPRPRSGARRWRACQSA